MAVNYQEYDPEIIEQAFLNAVLPLKTAGSIRTLEAYGGQLDVGDIEEVTHLFPAVFAIWSGMSVREVGKSDGAASGATLIVADRNLRGADSARRGATSVESAGVYSLLKQIRALVHNKPLVAGWFHPRILREAPLAYNPTAGIVIYEAVYEMRTRT